VTHIRSLIYLVLMALTTVAFGFAVVLTTRLLPEIRRAKLSNAWGRTNLWLLRVVCGLRYRLTGWDQLPKDGCIVMAKHQSAWETIALRGLLPPWQCWILKRELLRVPVFGWALASMRPIAIDRSAGSKAIKQIIAEGKAALEEGRWVVVFPEGTRVAPGERGKYNIGGAMLAERSGYPVLPIAHNAGIFWGRRALAKHPGTIEVVVGPLIPTKGRRATQIIAEVESWIESTVAALPQSRGPAGSAMSGDGA
jgi:1-acyl-sn-glycerol-3-phosphate acyltransferase